MYYTFEAYRHQRENRDFGHNFHKLCEAIALSGMPFDQYWREHAIPALRNSVVCESTTELLMEFNPFSMGSWKGLFGGGGGNAATQQIPNAPDGSMVRNPMQNAEKFANDADAAQQPEDPRISKARQGLEGTVNSIKNRFMAAMKDFHKAISDDAKKTGDAKSWKMAELFYKQMLQTVTPAADSFLKNLKISFTKPGEQPGYEGDFKKQAGQMQQGQQAQRTDAMKQKLKDPTVQARLDAQRGGKGGWTKPDLMAWATEFAKQQGAQPSMYVNPNGTPTQAAMAVLPDAAEWKAKKAGGVGTTAGASQTASEAPVSTMNRESRKNKKRGDVDLMESLIRGAGKRPSPANPMG